MNTCPLFNLLICSTVPVQHVPRASDSTAEGAQAAQAQKESGESGANRGPVESVFKNLAPSDTRYTLLDHAPRDEL